MHQPLTPDKSRHSCNPSHILGLELVQKFESGHPAATGHSCEEARGEGLGTDRACSWACSHKEFCLGFTVHDLTGFGLGFQLHQQEQGKLLYELIQNMQLLLKLYQELILPHGDMFFRHILHL